MDFGQTAAYVLGFALFALACLSIVYYFLSQNTKLFFKNLGERMYEINYFFGEFDKSAKEMQASCEEKASLKDAGTTLKKEMTKSAGRKKMVLLARVKR